MKLYLILISALLLASCSNSTSATDEDLDMGLNVDISLLGDPTAYPPAAALFLSTQEFFSCGKWEIDYKSSVASGQLNIDILGYVEPDGCIRVLAPAVTIIRLDDVEFPSLLKIRYNGLSNMARINRDGNMVSLTPLHFINIDQGFPPANL